MIKHQILKLVNLEKMSLSQDQFREDLTTIFDNFIQHTKNQKHESIVIHGLEEFQDIFRTAYSQKFNMPEELGIEDLSGDLFENNQYSNNMCSKDQYSKDQLKTAFLSLYHEYFFKKLQSGVVDSFGAEATFDVSKYFCGLSTDDTCPITSRSIIINDHEIYFIYSDKTYYPSQNLEYFFNLSKIMYDDLNKNINIVDDLLGTWDTKTVFKLLTSFEYSAYKTSLKEHFRMLYLPFWLDRAKTVFGEGWKKSLLESKYNYFDKIEERYIDDPNNISDYSVIQTVKDILKSHLEDLSKIEIK